MNLNIAFVKEKFNSLLLFLTPPYRSQLQKVENREFVFCSHSKQSDEKFASKSQIKSPLFFIVSFHFSVVLGDGAASDLGGRRHHVGEQLFRIRKRSLRRELDGVVSLNFDLLVDSADLLFSRRAKLEHAGLARHSLNRIKQ